MLFLNNFLYSPNCAVMNLSHTSFITPHCGGAGAEEHGQGKESSTENRAAKYIHMSCIIIRESGKYSVRCIVCQYEYVNIEDLSFIYCLMPISKTITISGVAANKDFNSLFNKAPCL